MKTSKLYPFFHLICVAGFIMSSCSDDAIEPQKVDVELDTEAGDLEFSNEELIDYVMSQFAELDENGNLIERTTYFRRIDESDSTAIYTRTATVADARRKFLSLVPESYQKKVIVKNDSTEMSFPMGTSPLMLKYTEGSTDGNVVATVQLPSQGAYTKIANTLTMVKSFGSNLTYMVTDYVCHFKYVERNVLVSDSPLSIDSMNHPIKAKLSIEKHRLNMLCYDITDDDKALYVFIPPLVEGERQLQFRSTRNYLVGHLYPYWFKSSFIEGDKDYNLVELQNILKDVLPSPRQVKAFIKGFDSYGDDNMDEGGLYKQGMPTYYSHWFDSALYDSLSINASKLTEKEVKTHSYLSQMKQCLNFGGSCAILNLYSISQYYPYEVGNYANYLTSPQIPEYVIENQDKQLPFFINADPWMNGNSGEEHFNGMLAAISRCCTLATNQIYSRDKNDVAHVISQHDGWEVVDYYKENDENFFSYFFKPVQSTYDGAWSYKPQGRWINCHDVFPFRILYLYEEQIEE